MDECTCQCKCSHCNFVDHWKPHLDRDYFSPDVLEDQTNYKRFVPPTPGVYLIVSISRETFYTTIEYIGSSGNLRQRHSNHHVLKLMRRLGYWVRFYYRETDNFIQEEQWMIEAKRPRINIRHNENAEKN